MTKITTAKLQAGVFLAGVNLGESLSSYPGAKQVEMTIEGNFLKVSKLMPDKNSSNLKKYSIFVPFTNVKQIEMEETDKK